MGIITPAALIQRPANATQYTANDRIAQSTTASECTPLIFPLSKLDYKAGRLLAVRCWKNDNDTTAASFNLHLFEVDPAFSVADNAALSLTTYRNFITTVAMDMSSGASAATGHLWERFALSAPIFIDPVSKGNPKTEIYGYLQAVGTYTPSSQELFEITLEISAV